MAGAWARSPPLQPLKATFAADAAWLVAADSKAGRRERGVSEQTAPFGRLSLAAPGPQQSKRVDYPCRLPGTASWISSLLEEKEPPNQFLGRINLQLKGKNYNYTFQP